MDTSKITVKIVAAGSVVVVEKELEVGSALTLGVALELAGRTVNPNAVYRTSGAVVNEDAKLNDGAVVLESKSETNG